MHRAIKLSSRFGKIFSETVKSMKAAYKHKCFAESTIFTCLGDFKKGCLSAELNPTTARPESVVTNRYITTV